MAQNGKDLRLKFAGCVGGVGIFDRLAIIEPPAQAQSKKDQRGGCEHDWNGSATEEYSKAERRRFVFQERLEPRPRARADAAKEHREASKDHQRKGHDRGTLMRCARSVVHRVFRVRLGVWSAVE